MWWMVVRGCVFGYSKQVQRFGRLMGPRQKCRGLSLFTPRRFWAVVCSAADGE